MSKYRKKYKEYNNNEKEWIYIIKSDTPTTNDILVRELILNKYLEETMKIFDDFSMKSKYIEYIFLEKGLPSFEEENLNWFRDAYDYVIIYLGGNYQPFEQIVNKLKDIKKEILESHIDRHIDAIISKNDIKDYILKIKMRDFSMRENAGYYCTDIEKINVSICYENVITYLTEGQQWAMDTNRMNGLLESGYKVELFGSTFNTRMKYFGCLYVEVDGPFGGLGTYDHVLNTLISGEKLKWRDQVIFNEDDIIIMQIGPPAVIKICNHVWELVKELMEKRKCIINIGFPKLPVVFDVKYYKYCKEMDQATEFISFERNEIIPFGSEEHGKIKRWYYFTLSNI